MKKELEELRDKYGFELQCSEVDGCAVYALKERKPLFINTIGEKFFDKEDDVYWFNKENLKHYYANFYHLMQDGCVESETYSQIYKTQESCNKALEEYKESLGIKYYYDQETYILKETYKTQSWRKDRYGSKTFSNKADCYRSMIEYAYSQGEKIEAFMKISKEWKVISPLFNAWEDNSEHPEKVYRIAPNLEYRAFKLAEADEYLGLKMKSKSGNYFKVINDVYGQDILDEYFKVYDKLEDGSPVGKQL